MTIYRQPCTVNRLNYLILQPKNVFMIGKDIAHAARLLQEDELVAIPTETVYGLAGNALSLEAVSKIFAVKDRPSFDPLIIHTNTIERLPTWTHPLPDPLRILAKKFMPGPLTILLPKRPIIPDLVTAGLPQVAVRIPAHPMAQALLKALEFPLAAPSANPFGYISPTTASHVDQQLGKKIPYILDGGPCEVGLESTIVGMEEEQVTVFRKGGLAIEAIEVLVGPVLVKNHSNSNPAAPGMLKSHYAPRVEMRIGNLLEMAAESSSKQLGILAFRQPLAHIELKHQIILSEKGNLHEAAQGLFAAMRKLDQMDVDIVLAELLPEEGLGRAINDRLRRASVKDRGEE